MSNIVEYPADAQPPAEFSQEEELGESLSEATTMPVLPTQEQWNERLNNLKEEASERYAEQLLVMLSDNIPESWPGARKSLDYQIQEIEAILSVLKEVLGEVDKMIAESNGMNV